MQDMPVIQGKFWDIGLSIFFLKYVESFQIELKSGNNDELFSNPTRA
jgi:hypothetical protein